MKRSAYKPKPVAIPQDWDWAKSWKDADIHAPIINYMEFYDQQVFTQKLLPASTEGQL